MSHSFIAHEAARASSSVMAYWLSFGVRECEPACTVFHTFQLVEEGQTPVLSDGMHLLRAWFVCEHQNKLKRIGVEVRLHLASSKAWSCPVVANTV